MRTLGAPAPSPALFLAALLLAATSCSPSGPPPPAPLDTANEACRHCRMMVSDARFAAQLVAPGEEPLFFDDIGCLRDFLAENPQKKAAFTAYVTDHRTREWVLADQAVFTRVESLGTPMDSHLIAHASASSRAADPDVGDTAGGTPLTPHEVFP
jgi:copper chaperone NosL